MSTRQMGRLIKFLIIATFLLSPLVIWKLLDLMRWLFPSDVIR